MSWSQENPTDNDYKKKFNVWEIPTTFSTETEKAILTCQGATKDLEEPQQFWGQEQAEDTTVTDVEEHGAGTKTQRWLESNQKLRHTSTYLQAPGSQQGH